MRRFILVNIVLIAGCVLVLLVEHSIARMVTNDNVTVQQLMHDTQLIDGQWTWHGIYPGRDTIVDVLRNFEQEEAAGFIQRIDNQPLQSRFTWTTTTPPTWSGRIDADQHELPRVNDIWLAPPLGQITLGEAILRFGSPLSSPLPSDFSRIICFTGGICVGSESIKERERRLAPHDLVIRILYVSPSGANVIISKERWQGFRRY